MSDLRRAFGLASVLAGCVVASACSADPNGTVWVDETTGDAPADDADDDDDRIEDEDVEGPNDPRDGGKKDAGRADAGKSDAGKSDAGKKDAGKNDAGHADGAAIDAGVGADATTADTGTITSVGGATVDDCQGSTALAANFNGATPKVTSGFAIYAGGQNEVYAYSRATVTDYAYGGQAGETKVRLLLPHVTGPGQYQGMMGVFSWDVAQGKWVNYATPTQTVVVTIASVNVVAGTGLMCNGWYIGRAEALFSPNNVVVLDFSVPLLTPSFPHSKPGPP